MSMTSMISKEVLSQKIKRTGDEIRLLGRDVEALKDVDVVSQLDVYSSLSTEAAIRGEYLARKLRELVFSTATAPNTKLLENAADAQGVLVCSKENGAVEIVIPSLIPNRKKKPTDFITAPLYTELNRFVDQQRLFQRFNDCVICITHVYNKDLLGNGRYRDHDNIELKGIIDTINTFLLTDDSMAHCDIFTTHMISDMDFTRITIMERNTFPEWILGHKTEQKLPC